MNVTVALSWGKLQALLFVRGERDEEKKAQNSGSESMRTDRGWVSGENWHCESLRRLRIA
jgi:hypothetical protein